MYVCMCKVQKWSDILDSSEMYHIAVRKQELLSTILPVMDVLYIIIVRIRIYFLCLLRVCPPEIRSKT